MFVVAACGSGDGSTTGTGGSTEGDTSDPSGPSEDTQGGAGVSIDVEQIPASPVEDVPSALSWTRSGSLEGLPEPSVTLFDLQSGGPPPDGIPSIDEPRFTAVDEVDWVADDEAVLSIEVNGDVRAYPVQILIWHEIVNDTVGGEPVAVTYCPLCNTALGFDRRVEGRVVTFGTSGLLWNSALVMYDRQTESLWSHVTGVALAGVLTGVELERYPVATVPFGVWREAHPDGIVLDRDTGNPRDYGRNPYPGYDSIDNDPFLFEGEVDGRYTAMTRMVGVDRDGSAIAVPLDALRDARVVTTDLAGEPLVVWWQPGTASPLDDSEVADGDDIGATGVFSLAGRDLTFSTDGDDGFVDAETGSRWNLLGRAVEGPLAGEQLTAVPHVDTFWFAWSVFRPETTVVDD